MNSFRPQIYIAFKMKQRLKMIQRCRIAAKMDLLYCFALLFLLLLKQLDLQGSEEYIQNQGLLLNGVPKTLTPNKGIYVLYSMFDRYR